MPLPYPSKTFTAGQTPTAAQWNELNANDQALAAGTGLNAGAVDATKLGLTPASMANTGSAGGTLYYINLGGLKLVWGTTAPVTVGGAAPAATARGVVFPSGFFTAIQSATATVTGTATNSQYMYVGPDSTPTAASWSFSINSTNGSNATTSGISFFVIGS